MNNAYSRLRLIEKLASAFKTDVRNFSSLLAHLSVYQIDDDYDHRLFDYYWVKAMHIIEYSYPKMKACGLKILNEFSKQNISKMYLSMENIKKLTTQSWWEIQAQILIICSNQLEYLEKQANKVSKVKDVESEDLEKGEVSKASGSDNSEIELREVIDEGLESFESQKKEYVETLLEIIDSIFHKHADVNV